MSTSQDSALKLIDKKFGSMPLPSIYWPTVEHKNLKWEITSRVKDPSRIWQAMSNLCGMATFFNTLASEDPYLYAFYACEMYRCGAAHLGYGKKAKLVKASRATRSSAVPPGMPTADWVVLASLRDHLNDVLDYSYSMGIPGLKDIPILGFLGSPKLIEAVGGITWPGDLYNELKAVGYAKVVNKAAVDHTAAASALGDANAYFAAKYHVLMLINSGLYDDQAGTHTMTPDHWVKLERKIEYQGTGVRAWVYNPAEGKKHWLPTSEKFVHGNVFQGHFYGFVAARR